MPHPENKQPTLAQIKEALLPNGEQLYPVYELIATVEAVFSLIRVSPLDQDVKEAFYRLEKQFLLYADLANC